MKRGTHHHKGNTAFTLVEMLVAMAVMALLALTVSKIVGMTGQSISATTKRMDAVSQGRFSLDWIGSDIEKRVRRSDLKHGFLKVDNNANDQIGFYSEVESYDGTRRISAIAYRVQENALAGQGAYVLERGNLGTGWGIGEGVKFSQPFPTLTAGQYQLLSDGVLRLEFCYLKEDGSFSIIAADDLKDVVAVVVAVAVLDPMNRKLLSDAQLGVLSLALPDCEEGEEPLVKWQAAYSNSAFGADVPRPAVQAIRFSQRYFYVR